MYFKEQRQINHKGWLALPCTALSLTLRAVSSQLDMKATSQDNSIAQQALRAGVEKKDSPKEGEREGV